MSHPYADAKAFRRLILLMATLIRYPGIGGSEPNNQPVDGQHHNALENVRDRLIEVGNQLGMDISACSVPTLRKDLGYLRQWKILDDRMYRWGYFLGTGVMTEPELQVALNALQSQSKYQRDPQVRSIYQAVMRRLHGVCSADNDFYPVRTQLDRVIVHTDPEEMMLRGQYRNTLFNKLPHIETAILQGQAIELYHCNHLYSLAQPRYVQIYPLQLIYSDIAWYLLHEDVITRHLAIVRLDRFSEYFATLSTSSRSLVLQRKSLNQAHRLLEAGWGVYLGSVEDQQLEILGKLSLVTVTVRFFSPVIEFILEGECRHPSQKIKHGHYNAATKQLEFVDYTIKLPPRSLKAFGQWINRFMESAIVVEPLDMAERHQNAAMALSKQYATYKENT